MTINIINNSSLLKKVYKKKIKEIVEYILKNEKSNPLLKKFLKKNKWKDIEINFLFVDDNDIKKYNKKFLNRSGITDVISFSNLEGEDIINNQTIGDAIISIETAERNSKKYNNKLWDEIFLLIIHATLHILGYEHETDNGEMREKENFYFKKLVKK